MEQLVKALNEIFYQTLKAREFCYVLNSRALRVMLTGVIAAGFSACQSTKTGIAANSDRAVAAVEKARQENEHLLKQSA
ncbi:MAG: hypothetical protein V7L20_25870 [Nostoc sp.]|uniref:hypothetical protein n=1 Tax=Nostoc sp. TaxID=1180 RepID=UPI002FF68E6C